MATQTLMWLCGSCTFSSTDTNLKEPWETTWWPRSCRNLLWTCVVGSVTVGPAVQRGTAHSWAALISRNLRLCMLSVLICHLLQLTLCFWEFNFVSVFITSYFLFYLPLFMFDILQSFSSPWCWCVDLSGAEGRPPLPHFYLAYHLNYHRCVFQTVLRRILEIFICALFPELLSCPHFLSCLRNIMAWTPK